ncbi:DUF4190 domain-containing protein [Pseudobacillus sp. 179-B 2D1 NHS]|uniref:DUF4190 domain-containing protein n=1 Tax=Pseudobacillus sp. 179-B 2D1 NHS TaxID=3374292 RepID=UPI00387A5D2D
MNNTEVLNGNATNDKAVVSLTLGVLSVVIPSFAFAILGIVSIAMPIAVLIASITGIIFSRKAKKEIIETNESGGALATWGLYLSIAAIVIQAIIALDLVIISGLFIR